MSWWHALGAHRAEALAERADEWLRVQALLYGSFGRAKALDPVAVRESALRTLAECAEDKPVDVYVTNLAGDVLDECHDELNEQHLKLMELANQIELKD